MTNHEDSDHLPDDVAWRAVSMLSGMLGGLIVRKLLSELWTRSSSERHEPPLDPADRSIAWSDAILWAIAAGVGAGLGRLISQRLAAAGWEAATGSAPPGIQTSD